MWAGYPNPALLTPTCCVHCTVVADETRAALESSAGAAAAKSAIAEEEDDDDDDEDDYDDDDADDQIVRDRSFDADFELFEKIGAGAFSTVHKCASR